MKYTKQYLKDNKIAIRCENQNEANSVFLLFKGHDCDWTLENTCFAVDDGCGAIFFREVDCESDGLSIVSYSEFVQDTRKIIGYRCPFDMYQQENDFLVNKGDLYIIAHEGSNCYAPKKWIECDLPKDIKTLYIPFEIIEQLFEPVYEEVVKACFSNLEDVLYYGKLKGTDNIVHFGSGYMSVTIGNKKEALNKENGYDFTPEFESKLKEMGINV